MAEAMDNAKLAEMEASLTRALASETRAKELLSEAVRELRQMEKVATARQTALASANEMNERLVAGINDAVANLDDAADRIFKIGKVLSEVSDKLGGDAGFESSATQVLAAAGIVRQYAAEARALLQSIPNKGDGSDG